MMPGDIGDARLNNYFLENVFQFFSGHTESLWHLPFFYPFPYVIGFSDNLFGSAPIYAVARIITRQADTAYQIWFLLGYVVNYCAAYYALRKLNGSIIAATIGALIFAFALPTTAHAGHAQLHYRFGMPLAIIFFVKFLRYRHAKLFIISGVWLVWQFYNGVYMGFFTLLLLATMTLTYVTFELIKQRLSLSELFGKFAAQWKAETMRQKMVNLFSLIFLVLLMILLLYPYFQVSLLYGAQRYWGEIATMLPRPQSYFLSDASHLWSSNNSNLFSGIPMRHEHQMFIGLLPLTLAVIGFFIGYFESHGQHFTLMSGMLGLTIVLTLNVGGFSLWYLLHKLPLASAIRAMTRIDQAILFPVAYLSVITTDQLRYRLASGTKVVYFIVIPLLIFEFSATSMFTSSKESWRNRLQALEHIFPKDMPSDSITFITQRGGPFFADELDAMWVSMMNGVKTLNGYSGLFPPGTSLEFGKDCSELPKRVLSFLDFSGKNQEFNAYREIMKRVVPIGFNQCDSNWLTTPPSISIIDREYTAKEFKSISYQFGQKYTHNGRNEIDLKIINSGGLTFAAQSAIGKPIRISWRFLDIEGKPISGWNYRKDLPFDIPANDVMNVLISIDPKNEILGGTLQVSLVQELVFWAHEIGIPPISIPWR